MMLQTDLHKMKVVFTLVICLCLFRFGGCNMMCYQCGSNNSPNCVVPDGATGTAQTQARCKASTRYENHRITYMERVPDDNCAASNSVDSTGSGEEFTCCTSDKCDPVNYPRECFTCSDTQAACLTPTSSSPTQHKFGGKCKATAVYANNVITGLTRENVATCTSSKDPSIDSTGSGTDTTCCETDKCDNVVPSRECFTCSDTQAACFTPTSSSPTEHKVGGKCKATAVYTNYKITGLTRENVASSACTPSDSGFDVATASGPVVTCCSKDKCDPVLMFRECFTCSDTQAACLTPTSSSPTEHKIIGKCKSTAVYTNNAITGLTREAVGTCTPSKDASIDSTGSGTDTTCCDTDKCDNVVPSRECFTCSDTQAACLTPTSSSSTQAKIGGKCKSTAVYTNSVITGLTRENVATCTSSKDVSIDSTGSGTDTTCCDTDKCDDVVLSRECFTCSDTKAACLTPTSSSPTEHKIAGKCKSTAVYTNYVITGLTRENVATCTPSKDASVNSTGSGTDTTCCETDKCDSVVQLEAPKTTTSTTTLTTTSTTTVDLGPGAGSFAKKSAGRVERVPSVAMQMCIVINALILLCG